MNKLLFSFVVLSIGAIGFLSFVNAQEFDFTEIEPECKGPYQAFEATLLGNKTTTVYQCIWVDVQITKPVISVIIEDCDAECKKVIETANKCRESNYTLEGCYGTGKVQEPQYTPDPGLTDDQNKLLEEADEKYDARCAGKDNLDKADTAFCNLYAERSICERGYLESEPIQTHDYFLTSNWKVGIWTMFEYKKQMALGVMSAAVEECTAQKRLQIDLGPYYLDMYLATINDGTPYHADVAGQVFQPIHPLELTPAVHAASIKVAENTRCTERQFQSSWVDYGCVQGPIESCSMPTDAELLIIYDTQWRPEFLNTPIKVYYQEIYDKCLEMMENGKPKQRHSYKTSQAYINAENYKINPLYSMPIGIPKSGIPITGCGGSDGECKLVFPIN